MSAKPGFTISNASEQDLGEVAEMFDFYRVAKGARSNIDGCENFLTERLARGDSILLIAKEGEKIVGFAQLYARFRSLKLTRNWMLTDLFVRPQNRRRGYGRALVEKAMKIARDSGADALHLTMEESNEGARELYRSCGFRPVEGIAILNVRL